MNTSISTPKWIIDSPVYHIFTLGACNAPKHYSESNENCDLVNTNRVKNLLAYIPHLKRMGIKNILLAPVWKSSTHGYDIMDYFCIDPRLGTQEQFEKVIKEFKANGFEIILDAVFNHSARAFPPFLDVLSKREKSRFVSWFDNVNFNSNNRYNDNLTYSNWSGCEELVKFDLTCSEGLLTRVLEKKYLNFSNCQSDNEFYEQFSSSAEYLLSALKYWILKWDISGIRIDASDSISGTFLDSISLLSRRLKKEFWLMGEMVHEDYRKIVKPDRLHSATNYEVYKSLYSSFNDKNLFEIAYALNRQNGPDGIYRGRYLFNFSDNHDVKRLGSVLKKSEDIYPLMILLFTIPGVPSIYYGSEFGIKGVKKNNSDWPLRPFLCLQDFSGDSNILKSITRLIEYRNRLIQLKEGAYKEIHISSETFGFIRQYKKELAIVLINSSESNQEIMIEDSALRDYSRYYDLLNDRTYNNNGSGFICSVPKKWGTILVPDESVSYC